VKSAAFLAAVLLLGGCAREPPPVKAEHPAEPRQEASNSLRLSAAGQKQSGVIVEVARSHSVPQVLRSPARFTNNENQTWRVGAVTEGRVVKVLANPGDRVSYGQVLARMHSHEIHESRAAYTKAVADLSRLRSNESYARRVRDRAKRLYDLKAGSLEQLEHAEAELRNAETGTRNGEVEVDRTRRHLTEFLGIPAEDSVDDHQHEDADHGLIPVRAPASGVVLTRAVTAGTVVSPASELFVISDLLILWAMVDVNQEHLAKLRTGMPVRVYVQAYENRAFAGRIGRVGEALDPSTRTVKVRVDVPNPGALLKPEMYATAEIELGGSESGLFVPAEAAQEVRGQTVIFVRKTGDEFEVRPVTLGPAAGGSVQVLRGLTAGEEVVSRGSFILKSEFLKASLAEEE
jgi:cobalt-zinc-cadmium efflux system membrane fusion protein